MIATIYYPDTAQLKKLLLRPSGNNTAVMSDVNTIIRNVKEQGDKALLQYNRQFDAYTSSAIEVTQDEWRKGADNIPDDLKKAIEIAIGNIETFHFSQKEETKFITTTDGVSCWRKSVGIERVGIYIPGGSAPLFSSLLMLAVPAKIAGCKDIVMCTPPGTTGVINSAILYAALRTGVKRVFKIGGAQAIAAMAYGTETILKVYKIFGPGNQYVTAAKMLVQADGVAIDLPAGPSELAVLADETCVPAFVAADLLSQAEHGPDSQVLLLTNSEEVIQKVKSELEDQIKCLPRKEIAKAALVNSKAILIKNIDEGINIINEYAPEHLIIATRNTDELAEHIVNTGSVFLGNYTPESAGDYASGANHTLPTNGYAKAYSGVSLDSFVKKITFQKITPMGIGNLGNTIEQMAIAEGLQGHARAVTVRTKNLKQ